MDPDPKHRFYSWKGMLSIIIFIVDNDSMSLLFLLMMWFDMIPVLIIYMLVCREPLRLQMKVFMEEVQQQLMLPTIRSVKLIFILTYDFCVAYRYPFPKLNVVNP